VTTTDSQGRRYSLDLQAASTYDAAHVYLCHVKEHPEKGLPRPTLAGGVGSEPWQAAPQMGERASADSLRWNLDLILDQRGADMAGLPGGASGSLVRDYNRSAGGPHRPRRGGGGRRTAAYERQGAGELARWKA
jgi:hypothetical protein